MSRRAAKGQCAIPDAPPLKPASDSEVCKVPSERRAIRRYCDSGNLRAGRTGSPSPRVTRAREAAQARRCSSRMPPHGFWINLTGTGGRRFLPAGGHALKTSEKRKTGWSNSMLRRPHSRVGWLPKSEKEWERLTLRLDLQEPGPAARFWRRLLCAPLWRRHPGHYAGRVALGRLCLAEGDAAGIAHLEDCGGRRGRRGTARRPVDLRFPAPGGAARRSPGAPLAGPAQCRRPGSRQS